MNELAKNHLRIFFLTLWQQVEPHEAAGSLLTLTQPSNHKLSIHIPAPGFLTSLREDESFEVFANLVESYNAEHDLRVNASFRHYANIAARERRLKPNTICEDSAARGGRAAVSIMPALSAEFDIGNVGHARDAEELPESWEQIEEYLHTKGIPTPSILVKSGGGYHAHWVLERPVYFFVDGEDTGIQAAILNQYRSWQESFIEGAPFHIDSTYGSEREWRLPGTFNRKIKDNPRPVELVFVNEGLYELDHLAPVKKRRTKKAAATQRRLVRAAQGGTPLDQLRAILSATDPSYKHYQAMQLLLEGKSFAQSGRYHAMRDMSGHIVWVAGDNGLFEQGLSNDDIISLFIPAFESWEKNPPKPDDPTTVEREIRLLTSLVEGAFDGWEARKEEEKEDRDSFFDAINVHRKEQFGEDAPEAQEGAAPLIVRYKSEWYLLNLITGRYEERWFQKDEVIQMARQIWEVAEGDANRIIQCVDDRGKVKDLTPEKLAEHPMVAGQIARSLRLSVMHETSYYDPKDQRFYIAHCPPRPDLEPVYHEDIDTFISILGGDKAEILRDWLAVLLRLDEPCAGLYLEGAPGVGKSLFVKGAASLWGRPETPFENFLGGRRSKFSNLEAPLVVLEEGVVDTYGITSQVRRFITAVVHSVERKGKDPIFLDGCPRLVVAANNSDALNEPGIRHTQSDSLAIMERIFYVAAQEEGREYLEGTDRFGNRRFEPDELNSWIVDGHFANHIAYLAVTREVKRDRLYCAQKEMTDWHVNYLLSTNRIGSYVFEWIARFATDPVPFYQYATGKKSGGGGCESQIAGGQIRLRSQELLDGWHVYMSKQIQLPSIQDVNMALETLCSREGHTYIVQLDFLEKYVNKNQIGRWAQIEANLHGLVVVK